MKFRMTIALAALAMASPALAEGLPAPIQAMVDDAFANGTDAEIETMLKFARRAAPDQAGALDARLAERRSAIHAETRARIAGAGPLENWSGRAELGASLTTGNVDTLGLVASFSATRQGERWGHTLRANAEFQETDDVRTQERLLVAYEPRYRIDDGISAYGLVQAERVPLLGYAARYSASAGLGYALVRSDKLTVNVQGGPAFRYAELVADGTEEGLSGRAALDARFVLAPGVALTNNASAFLDTRGNTFNATAGLEARLIGQLAARLSYNVQYESEPASGRVATDTQSRISFVYGF